MRAKSLALLLLALGCGLVASIGITQVMAKRNADSVVPVGETEPVFIALKDIPLGEPLTAQILKLEQWPKDRVPPGAMSKIEEVEGRRSRTRLYAGEPILKNKLLGKGVSEPGASPQIPKGYRVVSVKVDAVSGASSLILPGDRVDVLVHLLPNPVAGIHEPTTRTILQNMRVFAVNDVISLEGLDGEGKSMTAKTISLLVTPEQAQKVILASELGQVRLVMRSPEDDDHSPVAGVSSRELFDGTSRGERAKETTSAESEKSNDSKGFLDFLQSTMAASAASTAAAPSTQPPTPNKFVMRLLQGNKLSEVVLEPDADSSGEATTGTGFWRSSSSESGDASNPGAAAPAEAKTDHAKAPAEEEVPPKEPTKAQDNRKK